VAELQKSIDQSNKYMLDKDKATMAVKKQSRADEVKSYTANVAELQKSVDQSNKYMLDKDKATIEARKQARAEEVKTEEQQIAKLIALQEKVAVAHGQSMGLIQPVTRSGNNIYGDYTSLTTGTTTRADAELIAKNESAARLAVIKKEYSDRSNIIVGAEEARVAVARRADQEILDNFSKVSKNIGTFGSSVLPQGAYSNLNTRTTTADNSYNAFRDKEKALNESAERIVQSQARAANEVRENWDKSFMGALEHGTTFGHKLVTTMEYAVAGTAFYGMISGFGKLTSSITDANKSLTMFEVVLFSNEGTVKAAKDAKDLQNEIFKIGTTYGGTVKELNESALALGRAGIEGKNLAEGIKAVNQVAMLSGDSLSNITNTMVAWKTLYPEKTMSQLADSMAGVSNATLASMDDLKTMTTYILTVGQQAGVGADALLALAGAWRDIGRAPSTAATEARRFFEQISSGKDSVKKVYKELGINVDLLKENLAKGGVVASASLQKMFEILKNTSEAESKKATDSITSVLDKATVQGLLAIARSSKGGLNAFENALKNTGDAVKGKAEEDAKKVSLTYDNMWERIKVAMTQGSVILGNSFTSKLFDNTTLDKFSKNINDLLSPTGELTKALENTGSAIATILPYAGKLVEIFIAYKSIGIAKSMGETGVALASTVNNWLKAAEAGTLFSGVVVNATALTVGLGAAIGGGLVLALKGYIQLTESATSGTDFMTRSQYKLNEVLGTNAAAVEYLHAVSKQASDTDLSTRIGEAKEKLTELQKSTGFFKGSAEEINRQNFIVVNLEREKARRDANAKAIQREAEALKDKNKKAEEENKKLTNGIDISSGNPKTRPASESKQDSDAKKLYEEKISVIKANEADYFVEKNITSQYEQQAYHVKTTVPLMEKELGTIRNIIDRQTQGHKLDIDKKDTMNKMQTEAKKVAESADNQLATSKLQLQLQQHITEEKRIELQTAEQITKAEQRAHKELEVFGNIHDVESDKARAKVMAALGEEIKQIKAKGVLDKDALKYKEMARSYSLDTAREELKIQGASNAYEQIAIERLVIQRNLDAERLRIKQEYLLLGMQGSAEEKEAISNAEIKASQQEKQIQGAESYNDLLKKSNIAFERSNSTAQHFMNITEAGINGLNSGLQTFFDSSSDGFMNMGKLWQNIEKQIMAALIQELIINQLIQAVKAGMGAASSAIFGAATASAHGNAFEGSGVQKFAKGGSFANTIVSQPTYFAHGGGLGVMGEAGPEAVLPLKRNSQGDLGIVNSGSGSSVQAVTVQIKNESGEKLAVTQSQASTDMSGMIIDIVIDAIARNKKGMRDAVRR
jgi:TP901 family phage tail tape measure protein